MKLLGIAVAGAALTLSPALVAAPAMAQNDVLGQVQRFFNNPNDNNRNAYEQGRIDQQRRDQARREEARREEWQRDHADAYNRYPDRPPPPPYNGPYNNDYYRR